MNWPHLVADLFGGAVLANAVPHVVAGLMGRGFQTPFAKPPGEGLSTARTNVVWGFANLVIGYLLVVSFARIDLRDPVQAAAAGLGAFVLSFFLSARFGRFNGGAAPDGRAGG